MKRSAASLAASVMRTAALIALVLAIAVPAFAEGTDLALIAGSWVNTEDGATALRIENDGTGVLTDTVEGTDVPIVVEEADSEQDGYTLRLGDETLNDLLYDAADGTLVLRNGDDMEIRFARDVQAGMADPWIEVADMDAFAERTGFRLAVPEDADDVALRVMDAGDGNVLGEMRFLRNGMPYTARASVSGITDGIEDISGLYYDWQYEEETTIGGLYGIPAIIRQTADGSDTVEAVLWLDAETGIVYSLSTVQPEVDGLDLTVIADLVYMHGSDGANG